MKRGLPRAGSSLAHSPSASPSPATRIGIPSPSSPGPGARSINFCRAWLSVTVVASPTLRSRDLWFCNGRGAGALLCPACTAASQFERLLVCPVCALIGNRQILRGCLISGCVGQPVEMRRCTLPKLIAAPVPAALWQEIVDRAAASKNPGRYRRLAIAMRVVLGRRGKSERWTAGGRVFWRQA